MHVQQSIDSFLKENSSVASNRLVKVRNRKSLNYDRYNPARYLQDAKSVLYKKSPFFNNISKASFMKYANINGEFKNPHRCFSYLEETVSLLF